MGAIAAVGMPFSLAVVLDRDSERALLVKLPPVSI